VKAKEMQIGVTYMANAGYGREISNYYDEKQLRERYSWTLIEFKSNYRGAKFALMRNTFDDKTKEIPLSKIVGKFEEEQFIRNAEAKAKADEFYETVTKPKLFKLISLLSESGVWTSNRYNGELMIHYNQESLDKLIKMLEGDSK
jgi:hypothetical protein